jgi:hypothetical protein
MTFKRIPLEVRDEWERAFNCHISESSNGCWLWEGTIDSYGYGVFTIKKHGGMYKAHRIAFALRRGYCETELTIDHLCRNTRCVNPDHMELVTAVENSNRGNNPFQINRRKTHCKRGHLLSGDNLITFPSELALGKRQCKACRLIRNKADSKRYRDNLKLKKQQSA